MREPEMEQAVMQLWGEFELATALGREGEWHVARKVGSAIASSLYETMKEIDVAEAVILAVATVVSGSLIDADYDHDPAWEKLYFAAKRLSKRFHAQSPTAKRSSEEWAQACWVYILRNVKAIDDAMMVGKLQTATNTDGLKHLLRESNLDGVLPAVQAYYAYRLGLFDVDLWYQLCPAAQLLLRNIPPISPLYAEDRENLIRETQTLIAHVPSRRRSLVAAYAVPESVCTYFLSRIDFCSE